MTVEVKSLRRGRNKDLMEKYGCSMAFVSQALKFQSDSVLARRIRHHALNYMDYVVIEYEPIK